MLKEQTKMADEMTVQTEGSGTPPTPPSGGTPIPETPTASEVGTTQETPPAPPAESERERGFKRELFNLRSKNREYRDTLGSMRQELDALKATVGARQQPATPPPESGTGLLDNPEAYLNERDKRLIATLDARRRDEEQTRSLEVEGREAQSWLLAQKEIVEDPAAVDDIVQILDSPDLARVAQVSPKVAAEQAFARWQRQKGLAGSRSDAAGIAAARARSAPPSATPGAGASAGGKKVWTAGEVRAYLASLDHRAADFNSKYVVIEQAMKEGRIK